MSESNSENQNVRPSASIISKARIAARGIASLLRPAPSIAPSASGIPCDVVSSDTLRVDRLPPGQVKAKRWPILHAGPTPKIDLDRWCFKVFGLVEQPKSWSWSEFQSLIKTTVFADMHCVTRWSMLNNEWEGVSVARLLEQVRVKPEAGFVVVHAEGGYTTNLAIADFTAEDSLFAWSHNGKMLEAEHGGPLRLVVPRLYAWKSAKWVTGVEFLASDRPGFWEENGYHNHGNPWAANAKGTDSVERFW